MPVKQNHPTMNYHLIRTVSRNTCRLVLRNRLFGVLLVFTYLFIIAYQLVQQSNLFPWPSLRHTMLPSFFPYINSYLFNFVILFPLLLAMLGLFWKGRRIDSQEVILARPESNAEYLLGIAGGILFLFFRLAFFSLCFSAVIHLFFSTIPFNGWIYLFYLFTLTLPLLVFATGLFLLMMQAVKSSGLALLILILVMGGFLFYPSVGHHPLPDPFARELPNFFSELSGHPGLGIYLLQRGFWLCLGVAFILLAAGILPRISNHPASPRRLQTLAAAVGCLALVAGIAVTIRHHENNRVRRQWAESYRQHPTDKELSVVSHDIEYQSQGSQMKGESRLTLLNRGREEASSLLLYLNPGLTVTSVTGEDGKELAFARDHQVIRIDAGLQSGATRTLHLAYQGNIDERIAYLDIPDERIRRETGSYLTARFGARFSLLSHRYTLLTPEVLWYPVAMPPANPSAPYEVSRDFSRFTLEVTPPAGKTVISQGERSEKDGTVRFRHTHPLSGISLCIGEYLRKAIVVDSTSYELYLFPGHQSLLPAEEGLEEILPTVIRNARRTIDNGFSRPYPYNRFMLIESPVYFTSYFRSERGGSEYLQPELCFMRERGISHALPDFSFVDTTSVEAATTFIVQGNTMIPQNSLSPTEQTTQKLSHFLIFLLNRAESYIAEPSLDLRKFFVPMSMQSIFQTNPVSNPYFVAPLYYQTTGFFDADGFPMMDAMLYALLRKGTGSNASTSNAIGLPNLVRQQAIEYLRSHSLREAINDPELPQTVVQDIFQLKAEHLLDYLSRPELPREEVVRRLREWCEKALFSRRDLWAPDTLLTPLMLSEKIALWSDGKSIPAFSFGPLSLKKVETTDGRELYQLSLNVFNDSDSEGFLGVAVEKKPDMTRMAGYLLQQPGAALNRAYLIPPGEARQINILHEGEVFRFTVDTKISRNLPSEFMIGVPRISPDNPYAVISEKESMDGVLPIDPALLQKKDPSVILVDNEDPGFRFVDPQRHRRLYYLLNPRGKEEDLVYNLREIPKVLNRWTAFSDRQMIGTHRYTARIITSGDGTGFAEWSAEITREGTYEVFASIGNIYSAYFMNQSFGGGGTYYLFAKRDAKKQMKIMESQRGKGLPELPYHYTVTHADEESKVVIKTLDPANTDLWKSLGKYRFTPGRYTVTLSDQGDKNDPIAIQADAVKWVYVGE